MRPDIWLVRHGPTEWSDGGRHTSHTDLPLTEAGCAAAEQLAPRLAAHRFAKVFVSPATRARTTATLAGFASGEVDRDLREWEYGELEGLTTPEIRARGGEWANWTVWDGPVPGGETPEQVGARVRRVLARAAATDGDVLLFGHGHNLRVLTAVALDLDPRAGAHFVLDPATVSIIGSEHDVRALRVWNQP